MNKADEKPATGSKRRKTGVSGVLSLVLSISGFVIVYLAAVNGRSGCAGLSDLLRAFGVWSLFSLAGAISAFVSLGHYGFSVTSVLGLVLCAAPFLCYLYIMAINLK